MVSFAQHRRVFLFVYLFICLNENVHRESRALVNRSSDELRKPRQLNGNNNRALSAITV